MDDMEKKRITKSIAVILLSAFSINTCCYGKDLSIPRQYTLAAPSIFQQSPPTENSKQCKKSVKRKLQKKYIQKKVRELIRKGKTTILADDGEEFTFLLQLRKDIDRHVFTIIVQNRGRQIGFIDIFRNCGGYSFDSAYSPFKEDALYVEQKYREKYKHIGKTLVSLALGVVKSNGYDNFVAKPVRMGKEPFFERIGFQPSPENPRQFIFDLSLQPLPTIEIKRKNPGKKNISEVHEQGKHTAIYKNMEKIHKMNMELLPSVENGKTLWHVIPIEIIPHSIQGKFINMINDTYRNYPDLREKIKIVTNRQYLHTVVVNLVSDPNNIVDVAVADRKDLEELPEGVKALVFGGELGDFRQLEGIVAALRALQQGNTRALISLYEILTGEPFEGSGEEILRYIEDPKKLADIIIFNLKPIEIHDYKDREELNRALLEFIQSA